MLEAARQYLTPSEWTPAKNYVVEHDRELIEADKLTDDGETLGPLQLARTMAGIIGQAATRGQQIAIS